jgi:hypothetical protein
MSRRALVLFGLALAAAPAARAQTITIRPGGDLSSLVGMPFDVPIVADWGGRLDKLGSFAVTLRWDAAVLRFDFGAPGSFGTLEANTDSAAFGVLKLAGANPAGVTGLVTLGIGRFTPLTAATTAVTLQLGDIFSSAPDFANLFGSTDVQSGLFCPARGHWGDPDQDRGAGSRDALIALSEAVGLDVSAFPEHGLADVDADGSVKARDALIILSYAVGLDVSGFRMLRIAVGSCGSDQTTMYTVSPDGETLVARAGTELRFMLRATSGGVFRTLPDVFWRSSDANVLAILPDGRGVPVGAGSVVVTGKSGQRDSATATMTVVVRRTHHVVDALAISAPNRLGTPVYPYATLVEASAAVSEGDTVDVRPGRYADGAAFSVGVVVLGQTVGAKTVVLAGGDDFYGAALMFTGGGRAEVHNVDAERVGVAVAGVGVDTLVVDSLRYLEGAGYCGDYAVAAADIWRLEVRRSSLRGGGQSTGCAGAIGVNGNARVIVVDGVTATDFAYGALTAASVDSVVVVNSRLNDNSGYAIDVGSSRFGGSNGEVPQPVSTALVVEGSRLLRNIFGGGIYGTNLRAGRVAHSVIESVENDGVYLRGTSDTTDRFDLVADTIRGVENYWITSYDVDTLRVDSMVVLQTQEGYISGYRSARVTNSLLDDVESGSSAIWFDGDYVSPAVVDNVTIRGSVSCQRCANALQFYAAPSTVERLTVSNMDHGVQALYAGGSVAHSTMANTNTGVYAYDNGGAVSRVLVRAVTMTNVGYGVQSYYGAAVVDSLDFTGGYTGVLTSVNIYGPSGADSVTNSTIRDAVTAIELADPWVVAVGNTIVRPSNYGIRTSGNGTPQDSAFIVNNTITCDAAGASGASGIYGYGSSYRVVGNTVAGCSAGLYLSSTTGGSAVVRDNVVSQPPQTGNFAITVPAPLRSEIVGNTVLGGGNAGAIYVNGFYYSPVPYARVDSNTIRGGRVRAIWFEYTDTLVARGNLIDTVRTTTSYSNGAIGIGIVGATYGSARIVENRIRHVQGDGLYLDHLGSALLVVDSNAISTSDTTAIRMVTGLMSMTGNNITGNARYGLWNLAFGSTQEVHGNAFQGNGLYAVKAEDGAIVNVNSNWWGAPAGPNNPGADSVYGSVVDSTPLPGMPGLLTPSAPAPILTAYVAPLRSVGRAAAAAPAAPRTVAAPVAPARHERRPERAMSPQTTARQSRRPALPAPLAGIRRVP